ncbi:MAG: recombinase family protein, partial [Phenylobacterium sp.]|nr:recombinase family protein [Phenylobacterium sp.]
MEPSSIRAAQYVRMSTDQQTYSIAYQVAANAAHALAQGLELVRTYADEGVSGLTLAKRPGLQALLADIL